jgi:hypothetical protein
MGVAYGHCASARSFRKYCGRVQIRMKDIVDAWLVAESARYTTSRESIPGRSSAISVAMSPAVHIHEHAGERSSPFARKLSPYLRSISSIQSVSPVVSR